MDFSKRYLLWLILPPPLLAIPLSLLFLSQVLHLDGREWPALSALLGVLALVSSVIFFLSVRGALGALAESAGGAEHSQAASDVLRQSVRGAAVGWGVFAFGLIVAGTSLWLPTALGLTYFLVAALGSFAIAMAWSYASGKRLIQKSAPEGTIHYTGPRFLLGRKIAIVFVGFFIIAAVALVLLVSSRVSSTLEQLAVDDATDSFDGVYAIARGTANLDEAGLRDLRRYVSGEFSLYRIDPSGRVIAAGPEGSPPDSLEDEEIREMLRIRTGETTAFISPHVGRFGVLEDGAVLFVSVPWSRYADIPYQVAFYTLIIALLTTCIFVLATYFLSTDVGKPLERLTRVADAMATGDFRIDPWVFSDDEVGLLGDRFAQTRSNLEGLIGRIGTSGRTITDGVRVITGGTRALLTRSGEQAELTEGSSVALGRAREGAEAVLQAVEGVAERTQDASSRGLELQASAEKVARSTDVLFQSVEKTSSSTTEMDASAREMSGRTAFLADIGEEVLSFVTEMESTIDELRKQALGTAEISRKVREDAQAGGDAVNETVEGIREAQETTRRSAEVLDNLQGRIAQISQILDVIGEITERTNLLSLNAAIIAAQAGDQGAGFSVVAGEIRELADRTRGSTREIGAIVKAVQSGSKEAVRAMHEGLTKVDSNVRLAQNAASSLGKILSSANESHDMANLISSSLEEQGTATRHLHEVTSRMSDHIAQINRATQEQARGTRLLAEEAERVREIAAHVRGSTDEQSQAGHGINTAMEEIASDVRRIRDLLETQLAEMGKIAEASQTMLMIAQRNEGLAREFEGSMRSLVGSSQDFDSEVGKFKVE